MKMIAAISLGLLMLAGPVRAELQGDERLELLEPGEVLPQVSTEAAKLGASADWLLQQRWYSVRIIDDRLFVEAVRDIRSPDWQEKDTNDGQSPGQQKIEPYKAAGVALALPEGSLFAMRIKRDDSPRPIRIKADGYASLLTTPVTLGEGWHQRFALGGMSWILQTRYGRRPDTGLLAGSMALELNVAQEGVRTMLPPASGMAFSRQELLWLGDVDQDNQPDAILRRIWITGEQDYVFIIGKSFSTLYVDTDYPTRDFSSGAMGESSSKRHLSQKVAIENAKFTGAFNVSEAVWKKLSEPAFEKNLPLPLADLQIKLKEELLRFNLDYLPRSEANDGESSSSSNDFWMGPNLLRVTYRGKPQVLMQAQPPDSSIFRVEVGELNGRAVIRVSHSPHYNNSFTYYWLYSEEEGRFKRVLIDQGQGC
ncbi:MAG: hypothetical protein REI12_07260 [Pedobacter sp.]|nr:hypothetical protein [Pedobacter sp.]